MELLNSFKALGLSEATLKALKKKGFEEPTQIQQETIPLLLTGKEDIVGQAQTGTGKTAAFGLPLIELLYEKAKHIQALILTPTRELAIQVAEEINSFKGNKRLSIVPIYGGQSIDEQFRRLKKGVDIVVGTPGRIIDHINRGTIALSSVSHVILDEADEMLNMGFIDDIEEILKNTNDKKRMLLFSATMPKPILGIAENYMKEHRIIRIKKQQLTTNLTNQIYFEVIEADKFEALCRIIDIEENFYGLIFCRTKIDVDRISNKLHDRGYSAEGIHGDISQYQRERVLKNFKNRRATIMVATDVAARGIDINDLTHVINFSLPRDPESYVHRIGRTGRAGKQGTAITFVTPAEYKRLIFIQRIAKTEIQKKKIPPVKDVIRMKKERIIKDLEEIMDKIEPSFYHDLVSDLLKNNTPEKALSSIIHYAFSEELNERNYSQIKDVKINIDTNSKTRLFVAKGKIDGFSPKTLVEMIAKETLVPSSAIRDVRIFDNFSFITVSFVDAELIIEFFKKKARGKRPLVSRAKDKEEGKSKDTGRKARPSFKKSASGRKPKVSFGKSKR